MTTHDKAGPGPATATGMYRWYVLAMLFLVSVLNTMDKMLIPALAEPLRLEFDLSDSQLGLLIGLVFSVAYAIASIPMGVLIDRVNRSRLLASLLLIWSAMTLVSAKAGSLLSLALCRMGIAAAESGGNPTSFSLISDYFSREQRGRAIGIFSANSAIAGFLVYAIAGYVAEHHGWRMAFVISAIPGFLLAAIIFFTVKEPVRGAFDAPSELPDPSTPAPTPLDVFRGIISDPSLRLVTVAGVCVILALVGTSAFTASFFVRLHGLSLQETGVTAGAISGGGAIIGALAGGIMADRALRHSADGACRLLSWITLIAIPLGVVGFAASNLSVVVATLFLFQVLLTSFYAGTYATILEISPVKVRGATVTYITIALNLGGYGFGPQITGVLSDLFAGLGFEQSLRYALLSVLSVLILSSVAYRKAAQTIERSHEAQA